MNNTPSRSTVARVTRAESHVYKLVEKNVLTPGGAAWLIPALDIFHDGKLDPAGYPDGYNGASVSMIYPQTITVRKPAFIPAGTNWTCHIYTTPLAGRSPISPAGISNPATSVHNYLPVIPADGASFGLNLLNVHGNADGQNLGIFSQTIQTHIADIGLDTLAIPTGFRVTAIGYETYNNTAPLTLQGTCINYRLTDVHQALTVNLFNTATQADYNCAATAYQFPPLPGTPAQALQYPGSVQWNAKEGNYTMVPFTTTVNPPQTFENIGFYYYDQTNNSPIGRYMSENVIPVPYVVPANVGFGNQCILPIQGCGSYYTGLSDTTTLTVNLKVMIERMPSVQNPSESALLLTTKMAPPRDPFALAIYSEAINSLPVSVFVSENSFGDWFIDVANKVLNAAIPVLQMIPHPVAQALAAAGKPLEEITRRNKPAQQNNTALVQAPKQSVSGQQQSAPMDVTRSKIVARPQQPKKRKRNDASFYVNQPRN